MYAYADFQHDRPFWRVAREPRECRSLLVVLGAHAALPQPPCCRILSDLVILVPYVIPKACLSMARRFSNLRVAPA
jgi:hypothetical protein